MAEPISTTYRVTVRDHITDIGRERWDTLKGPSYVFSYDWLRARSDFVRGRPRFFLVENSAGRPVLAVPAFLTDQTSHPSYDLARVLELDDLDEEGADAGTGDPSAVKRLRLILQTHVAEVRPSIVVCAPALFGGARYDPMLTAEEQRAAAETVVAAVEAQAARDGASTVAWLYLLEGDDPVLEAALQARGYTGTVTGADAHLTIKWRSMEEYFASFPGNRRKAFPKEMSAFARAGVTVEVCGAEALDRELAGLELQWRQKYGRIATLDETLGYYRGLREHVGKRLLVFVGRRDGKAVGFTTFLDDGSTWWARFGGSDYASGVPFNYFNIVFYHPIRVAIERGVGTIAFSRTAYETKRSRGCVLRNLVAYTRLREDSAVLPDLRLLDQVQRSRFARINQTP